MTACPEGCGACCDPVPYTVSPDALRRILPIHLDGIDAETAANVRWAREHFTPIDRREGLARSPELRSGVTHLVLRGEPTVLVTHFYECDAFDADTRRCTQHAARPPMCSGFPWYDAAPDPAKPLPPTCTYNADVGRTVTPVEIR